MSAPSPCCPCLGCSKFAHKALDFITGTTCSSNSISDWCFQPQVFYQPNMVFPEIIELYIFYIYNHIFSLYIIILYIYIWNQLVDSGSQQWTIPPANSSKIGNPQTKAIPSPSEMFSSPGFIQWFHDHLPICSMVHHSQKMSKGCLWFMVIH